MRSIKYKLCLLSGMLLIAFGSVSAQTRTLIRGLVIDGFDNEPLIQASVTEVNSENRILSSTVTNLEGQFSLNVTDTNNKIVVKYIGYRTREIPIGSNTNMKIIMEEDSRSLSEVTITASKQSTVGMLAIDERDISMSMSRLDASEIADLHVASIDEALQGRMAGVDIVGNAGDPGSGMSIRVRGMTSINGNNQPLIVIDGIPLETEISADFDFSTANEEEFSQLLNVAPTDIQEIIVLKDAAATAIWGSRAANGVLQITTKRGTVSPPKVSFRGAYTIASQPDAIPTLNGDEYSTYILEGLHNAGYTYDPVTRPEFAYDPSNPEYYYNFSNNTDWVKAVTQTGHTQDYNLAVRGGSPKVRYSFSAGYWDQTGNTIETGLQRINTRMNLDYYVSDNLRISADISYTHSENQRNYVPFDERDKYDVRTRAYYKMPNQSIYYINEYGEQTPNYYSPQQTPQGSYPNTFNPVAMARDGRYDIISEKLIPKLNVTYIPNMSWRYTLDIAYDVTNEKKEKFLPQTATGLDWANDETNWAYNRDDETFTVQTFNKLYYTPQFEDPYKHRLISLLGINTYDRRTYNYYESSSNLASVLLQDPSIPSRVYPTGEIYSSSVQQRSLSGFLNVNYTLLDRYIVYGNMVLNGDSRFGGDYKYGVFPAFSARYRMSGEKFMQKLTWLDDFSFRYSWGITGKTPDADYLHYGRYNTYSYNYIGQSATYPSSLELSELRWQKQYENNFGLNFVALDYRLNFEFDYYIRNTKDQYLKSVNIPTSSGYSAIAMNAGTLKNEGWEFNVNYDVYRDKQWTVNLAFNVARSQNKITELSAYYVEESGAWDSNSSYLSRTIVGQPLGSFYGYKFAGVYSTKEATIAKDSKGDPIYTMDATGNLVPVYMRFGYPSVDYEFQAGDAMYVDINNDGNINYQDIVWLGDYNPLFHGGFTPSIRFREFSLNSVFHFRYGNSIINSAKMELESMRTYSNMATSTLKRWRKEGDETDMPRALIGTGYNVLASDRFVEDGSFLRWKSLTLRYNFKKDFLAPLHISDLYVYFTMQNLFVWTNYTGQDPEVKVAGDNAGYDSAKAPLAKTYSIGLNLTF